MTSIERIGEHTYGVDEKPEYTILTYTWGRWRADWGCPALPVKGTTWKIPPVKESCFTVEAFQRVLEVLRHEADYVWVDVACIDQENNDVKMHEIGRQVGIFKGAKRASVWLHSLSNVELKNLLDNIFQYGPQMCPGSMDNTSVPTVVETLQRSFEGLFRDPWFTSLWTLQESVLRRDAVILCRDGRPVPHPWIEKHDVTLAILANTCRNIYLDLQKPDLAITNLFRHVKIAAQDLTSRIEQAGFHFLYTSNPNVQYGASRFRQTKYPLDRIYGIMQIYGIAVGEAASPGRAIDSMEELEDQFAEALNARSALLGQAFIHIGSPANGKSWRITQQSRVPQAIMGIDIFNRTKETSTETSCTISKSDGEATMTITGFACSLLRLEKSWERIAVKITRDRYGARVMLDHAGVVLSRIGEDELDQSNFAYRFWKGGDVRRRTGKLALGS
ncbi:hypothetical protein SLS58_008238 [Diplodia intermedia]|uniref:Heterokaryon incompatibility domain-containing protein n=1 Tax=Diplodia intermedia TaxID=856260 RepID=A0ABR3TI15_9PEZI